MSSELDVYVHVISVDGREREVTSSLIGPPEALLNEAKALLVTAVTDTKGACSATCSIWKRGIPLGAWIWRRQDPEMRWKNAEDAGEE